MANMTPSIALASCEGSLRQLLAHVWEIKHGQDWMTKAFSVAKLEALEIRRAEEMQKRTTRGVAVVPADLLDYTHFYELVDLAKKDWNLVTLALGKQAITIALLDRFDDLRNSVAHSRELLPFETDLLSGIAGEIRNRVTLFMSTQAANGEHYARIESITDNYGNQADAARTLEMTNPATWTNLTLNVGDVVTFRCRASDPHGRELRWRVALLPDPHPIDRTYVGNDVEIQWEVTEFHVSQQTRVLIYLLSDSPYHRWPGHDGLVIFDYAIQPPPFVAA